MIVASEFEQSDAISVSANTSAPGTKINVNAGP
jgi:hypothetical protein